jgi:hypothetical protein
MSSEIKRTAGVTAVATVGLVLCLTAGEVFDASWLFIPGDRVSLRRVRPLHDCVLRGSWGRDRFRVYRLHSSRWLTSQDARLIAVASDEKEHR